MDATQPRWRDGRLTFSLADSDRRLTSVRLVQDVGLASKLDFAWRRGRWSLTVKPPAVNRLEYLFDITQDGQQQSILDPGNPRTVDGAFGQKSVAEAPRYRAPGWLAWPAVPASSTDFDIDDVSGQLWAPEQLPADAPAPLLVVHDGPEYAQLAAFTQYVGAFIADGTLPPLRVALLAPGDRNARYSADEAYAQALCEGVIGQLRQAATLVVGVGASLGGLAMLYAHCRYPDALDGLMLQSGSFFTPELDPQEQDFSGFPAITSFTADLAGCDARPVPTVMTCGTVEQNLADNRRMSQVLADRGYPVNLVVVRDAHNYTAWRDALHPNLTGLLQNLVRTVAA